MINCTLKLKTLTRLLWIELSKRFFSLCQSLREGTFSLSKTLKFEKLSFCEKIRSSLQKKYSSTEFDGSKNISGSREIFCFWIHVWMRSKSHQHRSCIFRQKIGNCVYISNRCSFTLREKIEKLESYQRFVETILAVLLNFYAESQTSFKSNSKNFLRSHNFLSFSKRSSLL